MASSFDYDDIPVGYYDAVYRRRNGAQSKWHHLKFARFRREMSGLQDHLDIGCGPGTFVSSLDDQHRSWGIDIARPQIDFAQEHYGNPRRTFEVTEAAALPYDDESFDVVTIIELIEHLPPEQNRLLIEDSLRVLRPSGRLLVSTPNYGGAWPLVEALVNRLGPTSYEEQHITHYRQSSLRQLMQQAGAGQITVQPYMGLAAFSACLGWRFADVVAALEAPFLERLYGLLLFATARKSP